ncbi:MAG TPA: hypothetical protein PKG63_01440 [Bacteroidales bacterium]|nr:hypothetical protein [Bacteroidales bacterium]HOU99026.1 hypothetical protein [Bacteroidales bacterium]
MKICFTILFLITVMATHAQKWEIGVVYSPYSITKLTFDKPYIIFDNYTSLIAGDNKQHGYFTWLSTGIYTRYNKRNYYAQAELNFFENKFKKQLPDWDLKNNNVFFTYSSVEMPWIMGYKVNPSGMLTFHIFAGINHKIERFKTVFFSSLSFTNFFNDDYNSTPEQNIDKEWRDELMKKFSPYYLDAIAGIGITYYGTTLNIRYESNLTDLNNEKKYYNANYKNLMMIRLSLNIKLYQPWKRKE